jgi:hypothetical protein
MWPGVNRLLLSAATIESEPAIGSISGVGMRKSATLKLEFEYTTSR